MGMGNYPCFAETIEEDFVKEVCPEELEAFKVALDEGDLAIELFANSVQFEGFGVDEIKSDMGCDDKDIEQKAKDIVDSYEALIKSFENKTGLELGVMYHDKEDRGDDVDGAFWTVEGVYILSPAGEKYKDKITRKGWTVYG